MAHDAAHGCGSGCRTAVGVALSRVATETRGKVPEVGGKIGQSCTDFCLHVGHICTISSIVNGAQFVRRIRKLGRKRGISVEVVTSRGKGSHVTLLYGPRFTTVPGHRGDLPKGTLAAMLKGLWLDLGDLG